MIDHEEAELKQMQSNKPLSSTITYLLRVSSQLIRRYLPLVSLGCVLASCGVVLTGYPAHHASSLSGIATFALIAQTGYTVALPKVYSDLFERQGIWQSKKLREIGVFVLGASVGVYFAAWQAFFHSNMGSIFLREQLSRLGNVLTFSGDYLRAVEVSQSARALVGQAEGLLLLQSLNDYALAWISSCALACKLIFSSLDRLQADWLDASFIVFFLFPLFPLISYVVSTSKFEDISPYVIPAFLFYVVPGWVFGTFGTAYVGYVRSRWNIADAALIEHEQRGTTHA